MVIYISENNNTRVVKPTEGRRGPQMSAPPLAPAAIRSAPTPVARQRRGQRHQRAAGGGCRVRDKLWSYSAEFARCLKMIRDVQQVGQSSGRSESADFRHQQNDKRLALSNAVRHRAPNITLGRQAVIHLPSGFSIYRLLVSKEGGEGAFQKLCTAAIDLQLPTDAASLGQILVSHICQA